MKISRFLANLKVKHHRQVQMLCDRAVPEDSVAVLLTGDGDRLPLSPFSGDGEYPAPGALLLLPSSLDQAQKLVLTWQAQHFDDRSSVPGTIHHLNAELKELLEAVTNGKLSEIQYEVADLQILVFQLAALLNVDLGEAILEKLVVLTSRDYSAPPDELGRILHVKPELHTAADTEEAN